MTIPQDVLDAWPNCATPDCQNKTCLWAPSPDLCYPCNERFYGKVLMDTQYALTHKDEKYD